MSNKLFNGLKFILVGATSQQRQTISMNIFQQGGQVLVSPQLFSPENLRNISTPSSSVECTHMLLTEHKRVTSSQLRNLLGSNVEEFISTQQIPLVQDEWINECISRGQIVGSDSFRVLIEETDTNTTTTTAAAAASDLESKSVEVLDSKKRKINEV